MSEFHKVAKTTKIEQNTKLDCHTLKVDGEDILISLN